jgi:hypothetical protein
MSSFPCLQVAEELKELQVEQDLGVQPSRAYKVQRAVNEWLSRASTAGRP